MTVMLAWTRPRRRPRRRWIDSTNEIWNAAAHGGADWRIIMYDREKWKEVVLALKILDES
jgi:hypothetical protein